MPVKVKVVSRRVAIDVRISKPSWQQFLSY